MTARRSSLVSIASLALVLGLSGSALAQQAGDAGAGASDTTAVAALEAQIDRDLKALSTEGCAVACRALASMQRLVERLCALEGGPRCNAARAKMRDAESRVRTACPECGMAANAPAVKPSEPSPPPAPPVEERPAQKAGRAAPDEPGEKPVDVNAAPKRGGCAGCTVDDGAGSALGAGALAAAIASRRGGANAGAIEPRSPRRRFL